jgi:hypothetical protein
LPDGFGIFGFFLVLVPTAFAIFVTSAVGFAKVGGFAVVFVVVVSVVVVAVVVELLESAEALGMSAVLVLPHAASPMHAATSASPFE